MTEKINKSVREYLSDIGTRGGKAGKGSRKLIARPPGYYSEIGKLGGAARKAAASKLGPS